MTHTRSLTTNHKLQAVYNLLLKRPMVPSWDIVTECKVTNPGGIVSEINRQIAKRSQKIFCHRVYVRDKKYHFYNLKNI